MSQLLKKRQIKKKSIFNIKTYDTTKKSPTQMISIEVSDNRRKFRVIIQLKSIFRYVS